MTGGNVIKIRKTLYYSEVHYLDNVVFFISRNC